MKIKLLLVLLAENFLIKLNGGEERWLENIDNDFVSSLIKITDDDKNFLIIVNIFFFLKITKDNINVYIINYFEISDFLEEKKNNNKKIKSDHIVHRLSSTL